MTIPAFTPEEILSAETIRSSRLKWVVVVDGSLPIGKITNAVACVAASVGQAIDGLIGPETTDAADVAHAGLPWTGCTILAATREQLEAIRAKAVAHDEIFVSDMTETAQRSRAYSEYARELASLTEPATIALGVVGPRNAVDRMVKRLDLLA